MDGNGSLFGTLCGNNREILHKVGSLLAACGWLLVGLHEQ
jgi:hypothetical protein